MHFSSTLIAALALGASALNNAEEPVEGHLSKRAVPPCTKCPVSDADWLSKFRPGNPGTPEDQSKSYPAGWLPNAAKTHGYTCYEYVPSSPTPVTFHPF